MKLLRDWPISEFTPHAVRVFFYQKSIKEAFKTKKFFIKLKMIATGEYLKEPRQIDKVIPSPSGTAWHFIGVEGEFFVYTTEAEFNKGVK